MSALDPRRVRAALEFVITGLDYDLHKSIECDEETGEDTYPVFVDNFIDAYNKADGRTS